MKRTGNPKRFLALLLSLCLLAVWVPMSVTVPTAALANRVADPSTMDSWQRFYGPQVKTTQYAGGVWMDKSVFTDTSAFARDDIALDDPAHHFLVALSAIASSKEVIGYSTVPTDTVLLVDASAAMGDATSRAVREINRTIEMLLSSNFNNRVAVIAYSEEATVLLPLGRYVSNSSQYLTAVDGVWAVDPLLTDESGQTPSDVGVHTIGGGAFAQAGLFAALHVFEQADVSVSEGNFQDGVQCLPVLVMVGGSAPTKATGDFDRPTADVAPTGGATASAELSFLTQLTASYVVNRIEAHYDRLGESLFYTVAFDDSPEAYAVSDPSNASLTDAFWKAYEALDGATGLELHIPSGATETHRILTIYKNARTDERAYADGTIAFRDGAPEEAFDTLVERILLRSRQYPTHLEGGNPDFGGYIEFNDAIGSYMEVKDVKGILLGDRLFTGAALTSKLNAPTGEGLGSIAEPSALGLTMRDSIKTRLGIADNTTAIDLIGKAYRAGQLAYDSETGEYSNYIAWYADAAGVYVGFYDESDESIPPTNAAYTVRSYGFLGEAKGAVKDSDMMYMTVQVRTSLLNGRQELLWKIPASLVPTVVYKVYLDGSDEATAQNVSLTREEAEPIRLLFEVGLESGINRYNVADITDEAHVTPDGARVFWTNAWDASQTDVQDHLTSYARFTPSTTNDRYYYTTDTPLYQKDGDDYVLLTDPSHTLDVNGAYYRARVIFSEDSTTASRLFEAVSSVSLEKAVCGTDGWYIPKGTVYRRQADRYFEKASNPSASVPYAYNLYVSMTNASYDAYSMLGNNGRLLVEPATGLKLSRTLESTIPDTVGEATYRLCFKTVFEQPLSGTFAVERIRDGASVGERGELTITDGIAEVTLGRHDTLYITELPVGATYTIEETACDNAYRLASVRVNGEEAGGGRLTRQTIDDIICSYVPSETGGVCITTDVTHPFGADAAIPASITSMVRLTLDPPTPLAATLVCDGGETTVTADENGVLNVEVGLRETVWLRGLPDGTTYTASVIDRADDGLQPQPSACKGMRGTVSASQNAYVAITQSYTPSSVTMAQNACVVEAEIALEGRERRAGDTFTFVLEELHPETGEALETLATATVDDPNETTVRFDLEGETFERVGTYHFRFYERSSDTADGLSYDTAYRRFHIDVTDADWDGRLEIAHVSDVMNTVVTEKEAGCVVSSTFRHRYAPVVGTVLTIPVKKTVKDDRFLKNGFRFALWDATESYVVHTSSVTDPNGDAAIRIAYSAANIGQHRYRLAECNDALDGMTYSSAVYDVLVTVFDNGDGSVGATAELRDENGALVRGMPVFENLYDSEAAQLVFSGKKTLDGRVHAADEFRFTLYQTDASFDLEQATALQTIGNDHDGDFVFEAVRFDAVGTYYFAVAEEQGSLGGVTYDDTVYTVTATVFEQDGHLCVATDLAEPIVFCNRYEAASVGVTLEGINVLTGRDTADGEFAFVLKNADGQTLERVTNVGARFAFDELTFDAAGNYRFTLCEERGALGGITYDTSEYTVVVTVTDSGNGRLRAVVHYEKNGQKTTGLSFRNAYTAQPYALGVTVEKQLDGRAMEEGEFLFVLSGSKSGRGLMSATNTVDGRVVFEAFPVYDPGKYTLHVSEVQGDDAYVSYDMRTFDVIVTIEDDRNGHLIETARHYAVGGQPIERIRFENVCHDPNTTAPTTVTTVLQTTATTAERSPQTGENDAVVLLWVLAGSVALIGATMVLRRKTES